MTDTTQSMINSLTNCVSARTCVAMNFDLHIGNEKIKTSFIKKNNDEIAELYNIEGRKVLKNVFELNCCEFGNLK